MFGDPIRFQTMSRIYRLLGQGLARPQLAEWLEWVVSGSRVQLLNSGKAWGHGEIYFGALGSRTRELRERGFLDAPSFDSTSKACRTAVSGATDGLPPRVRRPESHRIVQISYLRARGTYRLFHAMRRTVSQENMDARQGLQPCRSSR
jgi:hypothetical protein